MSRRDAAGRLRAKVARYYGPAVTQALLPSAADAEGEVNGSELMSNAVAPWVSGGGASPPPSEVERLVMAALLVLLHEGDDGHKVTFMLSELLGLLGWPLSEPSWAAVERALDFYMRPVRREYCVTPPQAGPGREVSVISLRSLIAGHEHDEESERGISESISLAGRQVTVTFNPDLPLGMGSLTLKSVSERVMRETQSSLHPTSSQSSDACIKYFVRAAWAR